MKRILLVLLLGLINELIYCQDIIIKQNRDQIKSKIFEITDDIIKYKDFDFQDGPLRNIKISDVITIIYANGKVESFNKESSQTPITLSTPSQKQSVSQQVQKNPSTDIPIEKALPRRYYKGKYFMIGTGVGNSYGFLGVKAQVRFGETTGFGFHSGVGMYFSDDDPNLPIHITGGVGIKFFPYKGFYLNAQFGPTGTDRHVLSGPDFHTYYHTKALYGPSFLVGLDQVWGKKTGIGFNVALGLAYKIETSEIAPAGDLGFIIRF